MNFNTPFQLSEQIFTLEVLVWVIPCVLVSVGIGFVIGRSFALRHLTKRIKNEQAAMVRALQNLVESTDQLTSDVGTHNTELATVGRSVCDIHAGEDLHQVQRALLGHIADVIESNRKLEDDLVCTRYRLEEQAQELDRTRREARIDDLSGVANRKAFDEALQFMVAKYKRHRVSFSLMLLDVDHFKRINDTHGHKSGDRVVTRLGETLKEHVRPSDFVGRFGGDEFAILFGGLDQEASLRVAQRVQRAVELTNFDVGIGNARVAVTLSMGLADVRENDTSESLFDRADKALYRSKQCGRNQLNAWDDSYSDIKSRKSTDSDTAPVEAAAAT